MHYQKVAKHLERAAIRQRIATPGRPATGSE